MSLLATIFGKRPQPSPREAVLITLHGTFVDASGEMPDFAAFQDQLIEALEGGSEGEFDSNEVGQAEATLLLRGDDAEQLYTSIGPLLRSSPICRGASVTVRQGGPGSPQRIVQL